MECNEIFFMRKMKYFGSKIQTQRIKAKKSPKIEVVRPETKNQPEENTDTEKFIEFKVISEAGMKAKRSKGKRDNFRIE